MLFCRTGWFLFDLFQKGLPPTTSITFSKAIQLTNAHGPILTHVGKNPLYNDKIPSFFTDCRTQSTRPRYNNPLRKKEIIRKSSSVHSTSKRKVKIIITSNHICPQVPEKKKPQKIMFVIRNGILRLERHLYNNVVNYLF